MKIIIEENKLKSEEFIELSKKVGWGTQRQYDMDKVAKALSDTTYTLTAKAGEEDQVIGCLRAYSDDLLMTFIPDIFVDPDFQGKGVGHKLLEQLKDQYGHTTIFFGSQPGNEAFFEKAGFKKSLQSYAGQFKDNPYYS